MIIGDDLKLLLRSIHPAIIMDAAKTVAESKWMMADNPEQLSRDEWIEEQAISLFRQLVSELNGNVH